MLTADYTIDGVFIKSGNNVKNNPIPKLKNISLVEFVKAMPQSHGL